MDSSINLFFCLFFAISIFVDFIASTFSLFRFVRLKFGLIFFPVFGPKISCWRIRFPYHKVCVLAIRMEYNIYFIKRSQCDGSPDEWSSAHIMIINKMKECVHHHVGSQAMMALFDTLLRARQMKRDKQSSKMTNKYESALCCVFGDRPDLDAMTKQL